MLISFVIPIYNCQKYILRQLESIVALPLKNNDYEVIGVDDGSQDNTIHILQDYLHQHGINYKILQQHHRGPATARNVGKKVAKGEWIWFIDADDSIASDGMKTVIKVLRENHDAEMVNMGYIKSPDSKVEMRTYHHIQVSGEEFLSQSKGGMYLWNNIFRSENIKDVSFIDDIFHIEDMCFMLHAIINMKKILCLSAVGYIYHTDNVSSISKRNNRQQANEDSLIVYRDLLCLQNSLDGKKKEIIRKILNFDIAGHLFTIIRFDNSKILKNYIQVYREMGLYPLSFTGRTKVDIFIFLINHVNLMTILMNIKNIR